MSPHSCGVSAIGGCGVASSATRSLLASSWFQEVGVPIPLLSCGPALEGPRQTVAGLPAPIRRY
jgi:hypothetical protein